MAVRSRGSRHSARFSASASDIDESSRAATASTADHAARSLARCDCAGVSKADTVYRVARAAPTCDIESGRESE